MSGSLSVRAIARWCTLYLRQGWGYACYIVWNFILTDEFGTFGFHTPDALSTPSHLASMAGIALVGFLVCAFARRLAPLRGRRALMVAVGAIGTAGMVLRALANARILPDTWGVPALAMCGLFSGAIVAAWLERFMAQGLHSVVWSYFACSLAGIAAACALVVLPRPVIWVVAGLLPVGSVAGLLTAPAIPSVACAGAPVATGVPVGPRTDAPSARLATDASLPYAPARPSGCDTAKILAVVALSCLAAQLFRMQGALPGSNLPPYAVAVAALLPTALAAAAGTVVATYAYAFHTSALFYLSIPATTAVALLLMFGASGTGTTVLAISVASFCEHLVAQLAICLFYDFCTAERPALHYAGAIIGMQVVGTGAAVAFMQLQLGPVAANALVLTGMVAMALVVMGGMQSFSMKSYAREDSPSDNAAGPSVTERIEALADACGLTPREREILQIWGTGHTSAYIEDQLGITRNTVRTHLVHIYSKTGTANKEELLQLIDAR